MYRLPIFRSAGETADGRTHEEGTPSTYVGSQVFRLTGGCFSMVLSMVLKAKIAAEFRSE